jgi:endonuclease YncB( thermonuclease family)
VERRLRDEAAIGHAPKQLNGAHLAFGQTVTVKVRDIDRYKRTVADVILPESPNVNQELVRARLAWWYQQFGRILPHRFRVNR